jgi:hypothetical protein
MFRVLSAPIIRSTIKSVETVIGTFHVSMWCGLNPLKGVQGRESIAQCHGQVSNCAIDSRPWATFNGFKQHHIDI